MSEYQYYEFLAIDRPLTAREMDHLRGISTRAQITPVSFVNEYHWGGLKADPRDFMRRFFDVHDVRIYDYVENDQPQLARMWAKRQRGYRAMGYQIR